MQYLDPPRVELLYSEESYGAAYVLACGKSYIFLKKGEDLF
jgi:hypothetical protein